VPLRLVTGPANSGKAGEVLRACRARLDEDPLLVVPRLEDVEHARRELVEAGAVLGVRVVRFSGLFELIAQQLAPELAAAPRATALARELIVAEAVRRTPLRAVGGSARRPGFARAAGRFVAELGGAMIEPARLRRALAAWAGDGPQRPHADDLAGLYEAYGTILAEAGLVDDELFARGALDALRRDPSGFDRAPVFVYGFDDFTPLELDALETLARRVGAEVTASLPFESGRPAFRATAAVFALLSELADEHVVLPPSDAHYAPRARAALARVERGLFGMMPEGAASHADGAAPPPGHAWAEEESATGASARAAPDLPAPGEAVRVHRAGGERAEVELAGAEVLRAIEDGTPPGDVVVVVRDPERLASLIEEVFGAYEIPFSLERTQPLGYSALGRGVTCLLRCAAGEGTADDLVAYLRTPGHLRAPQLADELEAEVRRAGVRDAEAARALWEERRWPLEEIDRLRSAAGEPEILGELDGRLTRLFAGPHARRAPVLAGRAREEAAVLRTARAALADLSALAAAGVAPPLEPAALADLLAEAPVPVGEPPAPGRVRVAPPEAIRARRFAVVVVLGLREGEFPRRPAPEPFLSDALRREINTVGGLSLPVREDELDRERLLFYACVSRAERRLVVSSRVTDEEGAPQAESPFVDDLRELFAPGELDESAVRRTLADLVWSPSEAPTPRERELARIARGPRQLPTAPSGLHAEALLAQLAEHRDLSVGELETFAGCGVRWLVERLVRPAALEPDPEPLVRGRLAHEVLRAALERLRERTGSARVTPETLADAEALVAEALDELGAEHRISPNAARLRAARSRLERDLRRHLRREAAAGGRYEPRHLELAFGLTSSGGDDGPAAPEGPAEEDLPALELEPDGVRLRGRIDRVDTHGERALVRDYKGGARVAGVDAWADEDDLQLALYMLAVRELVGLEPAGGLYVSLAGRGPTRGVVDAGEAEAVGACVSRRDLRDGAEVEAVLAAARARAGELADRLRAGDVAPCPERCTPGGGCAHPSICREEAA
jgi:ATP-dependent helicase/DNAse subunit B